MIYDDYYIFTPGPVRMSEETLAMGAKQTPYFRNQPFSDITFQCERYMIKMLNAPKGSKVIFLTASGTAGMESVVMNLLSDQDQALVINGGGFGQRFVDICAMHDIPHHDFKVEDTNLANIEEVAPTGDFSTLIVNAHETSVGHLYDLEALGTYTKAHNLFHIVDAISMFVTDPIDMQAHNIDVVIASSQKGLGLPPGLSMVVLTPKALAKIHPVKSLYFDFQDYLKNGERGQSPYTPAVTILLQLHSRLEQIERDGGIRVSIENARQMALYFREAIKTLPLKLYSPFMPNAMTTLMPTDGKSATDIVRDMEEQYKIMICPNGGLLASTVFRVSHMGHMTKDYTDVLIDALHDYYGVKRS